MISSSPRLIQTYLLDGTLEGIRIIEPSESSIKAFVIPRLKLKDVSDRPEITQPSLYILLSADGATGYVGECENFYHRIKNHDQTKTFWDIAIAFVSNTNGLEKSDVKYLESRIIELAKDTGSINIINKVSPSRNQVHEFKLFSLGRIASDINQVCSMLGYDLLTTDKSNEQIWYCKTKKTDASAVFRGDQFVMLAGSKIDITKSDLWGSDHPGALQLRNEIFATKSNVVNGVAVLNENISFKSPNTAGRFAAGRSINAWTTWKNESGQTMDEVMRRDEQ